MPADTELPRNQRPVTQLPAARRAAFAARVGAIAQRARGEFDDLVASGARLPIRDARSTAPPQLVAATCRTCAGHCCAEGGDHAYLHEDTLVRFFRAHPDATAAQAARTYVGHLGRDSFAGSCVMHGPTGCRLPRDMRSDLCNAYLCEGVQRLSLQQSRQRPVEQPAGQSAQQPLPQASQQPARTHRRPRLIARESR